MNKPDLIALAEEHGASVFGGSISFSRRELAAFAAALSASPAPESAVQPVAVQEAPDEPYCLHCEKVGHITDECWSTHMIGARTQEMDRLRASPVAPKAEPAMWCDYERIVREAATPPQEERGQGLTDRSAEARDAARYRWLRSIDSYSEWNRAGHYAADALDKLIDDALAAGARAQPAEQGEPLTREDAKKMIARFGNAAIALDKGECTLSSFVRLSNELIDALAQGQAAQPVAAEGVKPLSKDEILSEFCCTPGLRQHVEAFVAGARFAEKHHAIAASQDSAKGGK